MSAPDKYRRLAQLAIEASCHAPVRRHKYAHSAKVPHILIARIRVECEALGIDWRTAHADTAKIKRNAAQKLADERRQRTPT